MKILAVAALDLELIPWLRRCQSPMKLHWPLACGLTAEWNGASLYAVANGPGPGLAGEALQTATDKAGPFDVLMSIGLCGALSTELPLNAICTASDVTNAETVWPSLPYSGAEIHRLLSIDRFVGEPAEKQEWAQQGFGIVEMEAAVVAKYAAENSIPFYAVKIVSDRAEERFSIDFGQYRDKAGRFSNTRIALAALAHPVRYGPDLYRMATRGPAASEILGEFLAKSRF